MTAIRGPPFRARKSAAATQCLASSGQPCGEGVWKTGCPMTFRGVSRLRGVTSSMPSARKVDITSSYGVFILRKRRCPGGFHVDESARNVGKVAVGIPKDAGDPSRADDRFGS